MRCSGMSNDSDFWAVSTDNGLSDDVGDLPRRDSQAMAAGVSRVPPQYFRLTGVDVIREAGR